jgi:hypothetical protein
MYVLVTALTWYIRDAGRVRLERNDCAGELENAHFSSANVLRRVTRHGARLTSRRTAQIGGHAERGRRRLLGDCLPVKLLPKRIEVGAHGLQLRQQAQEKRYDLFHERVSNSFSVRCAGSVGQRKR